MYIFTLSKNYNYFEKRKLMGNWLKQNICKMD